MFYDPVTNTINFRIYQTEANIAISEELLVSDKCIVKMFCGAGKSLLMRYCKINHDKNLVVYVFPSLALIDQFYRDYFIKYRDFPLENILKICSENEATTNTDHIRKFLSRQKIKKIICVTYNSFHLLKDSLGINQKINVCIFDEAHHIVGHTYQKLIFENDFCEKQIFFTATPKNANGIIMYDRERIDAGMCGKLVYDYSYLRGMNEGYLNPFEIRIAMSTENTNKSVYESMARAILSTGNTRVLTFHSDVNTERDTSVNNFVNDDEFTLVFKEIQKKEFPNNEKYKKVKMIGLSSKINSEARKEILATFDAVNDNEVMVLSSCRTVGEGIDTKNANMVVFVDPKTSYIDILQNMGRIVRKVFGQTKPNSTILIPCWVDKAKYLECNGDKEKCDEVIRQDMSESGNFNCILNVLSALKQEDEDIYDICLHYPDTYSPQEVKSNLEKQGYAVDEQVGDGGLMETIEHLLETDLDYDDFEDFENEEEMIMRIAEDNDVCIEVFTHSLENPIERYNSDSGEFIRLYKDTEDDVYCPIILEKSKTKRNTGSIAGPNRDSRLNINIHYNPDIKVLWNIVSDITNDICSCIIDCEVVKYDAMEAAQGIVERANERARNGLNLLPRHLSKQIRTTPELIQENKDARKLHNWKDALKGKGKGKCYDEVCEFLDNHLPNWRISLDNKAMEDAQAIVERANERVKNNGNLLPRHLSKQIRTTPELEQEHKDARKLHNWKDALKGKGKGKCSDEVRYYLDEHLLNWRFDKRAMEDAKAIVERANKRIGNGLNLLPSQIPKENRTTPELIQECKDNQKLHDWKKVLKKGLRKCYDEVCEFLDNHLPNWRISLDNKAMEDAQAIVERANIRIKLKLNLLPRNIPNTENRHTPELEQEHIDARKLGTWKDVLKGKGKGNCSNEVRNYLDNNLPNWRMDFDNKAMKDAQAIVERAKIRIKQNLNLLPRNIHNKQKRLTSPELEQEHTDSQKLGTWKKTLNGKGKGKCSDEVRDYLDEHLPKWRKITDISDTSSVLSTDTNASVSTKDDSNDGEITIIPKKKSMKLKQPSIKETPGEKRQRTKSELSVLHQRFKTMNSQNLNKEFKENPESWTTYHAKSEENEKSFPEDEIPRNRVIRELNETKTKRQKLVVDMGCGRAQIAQHYQNDTRFKFINYDHISSNDTVISCDISHTPLEDNSVEICILSLSMWGSNCHDYILEAARILESRGVLYIIEPTKRWSEKDAAGNNIKGEEGGKLRRLLEEYGFQILEESVEKFCLFVCIRY